MHPRIKPLSIRTLAVALALACSAAFALPTLEQVQAEVQQGHYDQAATMMGEVVAARPDSARAHYVYAEILAHQGRFADAAEQARLARAADPAIRFAERSRFEAFERSLQNERAAESRPRTPPAAGTVSPGATRPATAAEASGGGLPGWVWIAGLVLVALVVWRLIARRPQPLAPGAGAAMGASPGAAGYGPAGPYGGYPPGSYPTRGGGMMGTGMAAAGGFAAGMLADRLMHDRDGNVIHPDTQVASSNDGLVPGMFDGGSSAEADALRDRPVDFGAGGDDWGGGGGGDAGGSSDDGGGW